MQTSKQLAQISSADVGTIGRFETRPDVQRELAIQQLIRTLGESTVRCLSWSEIHDRLRFIWRDPQQYLLIQQVLEMQLSEEAGHQLGDELDHLSRTADVLRPPTRYVVDRAIIRLSRALPKPELYKRALADLGHSRKPRRVGAIRLLRNAGVTGELTEPIAEQYRSSLDQELLKLIARSLDSILAADTDWLLIELEDEYWRMRVVQGLVFADDPRIHELVHRFPREFVWAVGRMRATRYAKAIHDLINRYSSDWQFLSLGAWALGMLHDRVGLGTIRSLINAELSANPLKYSECSAC